MDILKKNNLLAVGLIGILLVILALAGCSGTSTPTTSKAPVSTSPAPTTTVPSQTPKTTIPVATTTPVPTFSGELNISAAASLTDALKAVDDLYTQANPKVKIVTNFAGSGTLQTQIEQGAPADVFISAASTQMDNLQKQGLLIDDTRYDLLNNRLVLITPADTDLRITSFTDLALDKVTKVAIGDPKSVPAGKYAIQLFDKLGITAQVQPKEVLGSDVRQVLTYVETGNVQAGIVYYTDALTSHKIRTEAYAPDDINAKIVYPVAVIKATKNVDVAKDYLKFLLGAQAKVIFEKYGFTMAG
jgi:molybdate transport system substrate-binding protein